MRIGFDAKRLFHNHTGLGVYSRMLIRQLCRDAPEHELLLYDKRPHGSDYLAEFEHLRIECGKGPLWRTFRLGRQVISDQCELYHGLSHELPRDLVHQSIGKVVTIHDLIFEQYPKQYAAVDRRLYRWKWKHACDNADVIISISEATKSELVNRYSIDAGKIEVIPPLHDERFERPIDAKELNEVRAKYKLPGEFILSVGSVIERKNLLLVIDALAQLDPADRMPLVVVGSGNQYLTRCRLRAKELGLEKDVLWTSHVPNHDLPAFYALALLSVYPSLAEGFGIPVIESLYCGTPVITSNRSSLPEAAGPGGLLVDPEQVDELQTAMSKLIQDSTLREELILSAREHLAQHRNPILVKKVVKVYAQLAARA